MKTIYFDELKKEIALKESYLKALYEASKLVEGYLKNDEKKGIDNE